MNNKPRCYTYRLAPCRAFDIEGTESWLTDLSDQGLLLTDKSFLLGVAKFERASPRHMVYRADAGPHPFADAPPDDAAVDLNARYGWEYAGRRGPFHYYRTAEAAPRELHTDPAVQALPLRKMEQKLWMHITFFALFLLIFPLVRLRFCLLLPALTIGSLYFLLWAVFTLFIFGSNCLLPLVQIRRLRRRLFSAGALDHRKDWRRGAAAYHIRCLLLPVLALICLILLFLRLYWWIPQSQVSRIAYEDPVPFATAAELFDGEFAPDNRSFPTSANQMRRWSDLLAPENITWVEDGAITTSGDETDIYYSVEYHQMGNPVLARWLAAETLRYKLDSDCVRVEPPALEADAAYAYLDGIGIPHLILVMDTQVVHVSLLSTGNELALEDWAAAFAAQLDDPAAFSRSD